MFKQKIVRIICFVFIANLMVTNPEYSFSQAPAYSREAVAARESSVELEGISITDNKLSSRVGSDMLMSGERSIGNAKRNVRNDSSRGGQSAMLRFDQHRNIQPPKHTTLRLGSWYTDIGIGISVGAQYTKLDGAGVTYNTNNGRGRYLKDGFDMPIEARLTFDNYVMISRHIDLSFNINVTYAYYPFETQEDTLDVNMTDEGIYATFSSEFELARDLKLLLYDDILYQTDYIDTRGAEDNYGGLEYEHLENTIGADLDWLLTTRDNISLSGSRRDVISFDEEFEDQDGVFYSEMISYQRELTRFAAAGVFGTAEQSLYELDTRENINIYGVGAYISTQITRKLFGSASLGYNFSVYPDSDNSRSEGSLAGSLGLGHQISEEKEQSLYYDRSQREAFSGGVDVTDSISYRYRWSGGTFPGSLRTEYSLFTPTDDRGGYSNWDTDLDFEYKITRRWNLDFGASYAVRWNDPDEAQLDGENADVNSDYATLSLRVGTSRPLTKKTRFVMYAEHADRTSSDDNLSYTQDSIVATLDWTHKF